MTENQRKHQASEVYKTMIVSDHPDTIKNLTGWRRPSGAYVLLETNQYNLKSDGVGTWGKGLGIVNAESRAEVMGQVTNLLKKGARILDYGNFPKLNDPDPKRAAKAQLYSQGTGQEPWAPLEQFLRQQMTGDRKWGEEKAAMQAENDALKAKLAELEKKKAAAAPVAKEPRE